MQDTIPVTAFIYFQLPPQLEEIWNDVWTQVRDAALTEPSCHQFSLLRDRYDHSVHVVLTAWDRVSDFDAFVREAGLIWCERATACAGMPPTHTIYEAIALEESPQGLEHIQRLVPVG
jgi:quinol monooxygenase YgiN